MTLEPHNLNCDQMTQPHNLNYDQMTLEPHNLNCDQMTYHTIQIVTRCHNHTI